MDGNVRLRVMAQMAQTAAYLECPCQGKAFSGLCRQRLPAKAAFTEKFPGAFSQTPGKNQLVLMASRAEICTALLAG